MKTTSTANRMLGAKPSPRHWLCLLMLACCTSFQALANPFGAQVVSGSATLAQSGSTLTVANSPHTILNWQNFSINPGETLHFNQQDASSAVLIRVLGADPAQLLGKLSSNGRVLLLNPAGFAVGQDARIDVAGLVASTLKLSDEDFLAGSLDFAPTLDAGGIHNAGGIATPNGGTVYLIAPQVENRGLIATPQGETILAAGHAVQLNNTATPGVSVQIAGSGNNAINVGRILADSGRIGMVGALVRNSGELNAGSLVSHGGRVFLKASQDTYVDQDATVTATGSAGGNIEVLGKRVAVMDNARLDASGQNGGGTVLVGGDYQGRNPDVQNASVSYLGPQASLKADAIDNGDGGKAIIWADDSTRAYGSIAARGGVSNGDGGFVEVSGKQHLDFHGTADTRAANGMTGTLLLDPTDITIDASNSPPSGTYTAGTDLGGGVFDGFTAGVLDGEGNAATSMGWDYINGLLSANNLVIQTSSTGAGTGTIDFAAAGGAAGGANSLTFLAENNITVSNAIQFTSSGNLVMVAGWDSASGSVTPTATHASNVGDLTISAPISHTGGGYIKLAAKGQVSQSAGAIITASALSVSGGSVSLPEANPVDVISGVTTAGDFLYHSASLLTVSNVAGVNGISVPTANNIRLSSDVGINQNAGSVIKANGASGGGLALITAGSVFLDQANDVRTIVASLTGAGGDFMFANSENVVPGTVGDLVVGSLTVGGVTTTGIATNGGDITLDTPGLLTVLNPIAAGAGNVGLYADDLILSNTVTSTSEVGISPYSANIPITVGAACSTPPCLSVTNLWQINAPTIGIGEDGVLGSGGGTNPLAGALSVAGITAGGATLSDRHANTTRIGLFSGAGITQTGIINVQDLEVGAGGSVTLTGANMVSNLAGKSATGPFQFTNAQTFNIAVLSGGSGFSAYSMPGIQALSGDVVLTANGATSDIVANSPQNYAAITATNGNVTLNAGRDVLIGNSGGTFANLFAYGAAKNVSVTAARNTLVDNFSQILSDAGNVSLTATGGNVSIRSSVNGSGSWIGAGTAGTGGIVTISAPAGSVLAPAPGYGGDVGGGHISTGSGGELVVTADNGITLNGLNTVAGFSASNGIAGDVVLNNTSSPLNILDILNPSGAVSVTNQGAIAVGVNGISAGGAVALTSGSAGSPTASDIISINGPITGSSVTLAANSVTGTIPAGATVLTYTAPTPVSDPTPSTPTEVQVDAPGQTVVAVVGLPVRIAAGANVDGTTINFPANAPITVELGTSRFVVSAQTSGTQLTLKRVVINGESVLALVLSAGSARIVAGGTGETLLVLGDGATPVQSGTADAAVDVKREGETTILSVGSGFVVLPGAQRTTRRAATAEYRVYAGERATLNAAGQVASHVLGNASGDGAGDPLTLNLPANLSLAASVPKLDARAERLGKTVQQALADAVGATLVYGQTTGVLALELDGQRVYALPLGTVAVDPTRADGVSIEPNGMATVGMSGIAVALAPSVAYLNHLAEDVAAALPGTTLKIGADGVMVATLATGENYALRPDWFSKIGVAQPAGFAATADGRLGYVKNFRSFVLHPAFADFAALTAAVGEVLPGATLQTNPDSTVTLASGDQHWTLTPQMQLEAAPEETRPWWAEADGTLRLRNADGAMQGFRAE